MKIMDVLDLFMRDSSLGQFTARLSFLELLHAHFKSKKKYQRYSKRMSERLRVVVNVLNFVSNYYAQFREKLASTVARLDADAREKVKTLIDVSKWTVQKFAQVKNNIDKRHRQLNKACQ